MHSSYDLVWSNIFLRNFLGRSCCAYVVIINKDLLTNTEIGCRKTSEIHGYLVMFLCSGHLSVEFCMKLFKVHHHILTGTLRSNFPFRVYSDIRVVPFVGKEQ
jgi:hypothetical protein